MSVLAPRLFPLEQHETTSDDYYTPAWVFETMGIDFDLDVCAPPGGIPWIPARRFFTMADDGLAQPWEGRVWMNPPYSDTAPWVRRFIEHRHGVCLVQASKGIWSCHLWAEADAIAWPREGQIFRFVRPDDERTDIYMPLQFVAFGEECVDAIARLGVVRKIV